MKNLRNTIISMGISAISLTSCYTLRPDSTMVESPDYNQRVSVTNPHYTKVITPVGYGVMGLSLIGGVALGYQSSIVTKQNGNQRVDIQPLNAIIGGVFALGIDMIASHKAKVNQDFQITSFDAWLKDANKNYVNISNSKYKFDAFYTPAARNYTVKNIQDVRDFKAAVPNSNYENKVIKDAIDLFEDEELISLIDLCGDNPQIIHAKEKYISHSKTIDNIMAASKKYPDAKVDLETLCFAKVINTGTALNFNKYFPNSDRLEEVFNIGLKGLPYGETANYIQSFPFIRKELLDKEKEKYILSSGTIEQLVNASNTFPEIKLDIEKLAFAKVNDNKSAISFNKYFDSSDKLDEAFKIGLGTLSANQYGSYVTNFKKVTDTLMTNAKLEYIKVLTTVYECYQATVMFPELYDTADDKAQTLLTNINITENYLYYFVNSKRYSEAATIYGKYIQEELGRIGAEDEIGNYNFCKKYEKKTKEEIGKEAVFTAAKRFTEINDRRFQRFKQIGDDVNGNTMVKIRFKTKDVSPASPKINQLTSWMKQLRSSYSVLGIKIADKDYLFTSIDNAETYYELGIINASWYRAGTEKDGSFYIENSGFPKFKQNLKEEASELGLEIVGAEYVGSYSDDERKAEQRRQSASNYSRIESHPSESGNSNSDSKKETDYENLVAPRIEKEEESRSNNCGPESTTCRCYYITFDMDEDRKMYSGSLFYHLEKQLFYTSNGPNNFYYSDKTSALNALYVYKKFGEIIKKNKER